MLETSLYSRLRSRFQAWGQISRVENSIESGMWDIHYCFDGQIGWIETKVEKSGYLYFEKYQPNWGRRFYRAGMTNLFIIASLEGHGDLMEVYHITTLMGVKLEIYRKWRRVRTGDLEPELRMKKPYDWDALRLLLSEQFTCAK